MATINFRLIRHLWLFLAVAEEQNFGRAAKRLGMSQPPLTEQIQVLEQSLKVKLFERSHRGAKLTPAGAAILPAVQKLAEQMQRLEISVRETLEGKTGVLNVGAIASAMLDVLPGVIGAVKKAHPGLTISVQEMDSAEAITALQAGDIDLAFGRFEGDLGPIHMEPLLQDRLAVALPDGHPMAGMSRIRFAMLAQEDFVMFTRGVNPAYYDSLLTACRDHGFSPRILHEVRSVASQVAFVGCGQGVALVPASLKKLAPASVVIRPLKEAIPVVTTGIAWNTERRNPLVESVVQAALAGRRSGKS